MTAKRVTLTCWDGQPQSVEPLRPSVERLIVPAVRAAGTKPIIVKPNFRFGCDPGRGTNTDPNLLRLVISCILDAGAESVHVLDSTPHVNRFHPGLPRVTVHDTDELQADPLSLGVCGLQSVSVPRAVSTASLIVSVPVLKTHALTLISGAVKGVMGLVSGQWERHRVHLGGLEPGLAAIHRALPDGPVIMDAGVALEGLGPGPTGTDRHTGFILLAADRVSADIAVCRMAQLDPKDVGHVFLADRDPAAQIVEVVSDPDGAVAFPPTPPLSLPPMKPPPGLTVDVVPGNGSCLLCARAVYAALHIEREAMTAGTGTAEHRPCVLAGPGIDGPFSPHVLPVGNCVAHAWAGRQYVPGCPPSVRHIRPLLRLLAGE